MADKNIGTPASSNPAGNGSSMSLREFFEFLWRLRYWIVASAFLALVAAFIFLRMQNPVYQRSAWIRLNRNDGTGAELELLSLAVPLLNNMQKKFYYQQTIAGAGRDVAWETANLTPRETEIAKLLCQGVKPANISKALYISLPTAYKHISNIYEKMHVTSRQELLVKLLK